MAAYKVIHATHPYIMKNKQAIELTIQFLKTGELSRSQGSAASAAAEYKHRVP
jgi:hypothetical protein